MKRSAWFLVVCVICAPSLAAARAASVSRGGYGFLYPDSNSFANPGLFSSLKGTAVEALYSRVNNSKLQSVTPSVVYGDGAIGVGAYGSRTSTDLGSSTLSTDEVGAGLGVALGKGRAALGLSYSRSIDTVQANAGSILSTVTVNGKRARLGIGASTTLKDVTRDRQSGIIAAGFGLIPSINLETVAKVNDFGNWKDFSGSLFVSFVGQVGYAGAGYQWLNTESAHEAQARVGLVVARLVDLSVHATHVFKSGREPSYGGSFRTTF